MCQFDNTFILCTCTDNLQKDDIDWRLRRRKPNTSNLETWMLNNPFYRGLSNIAGMIKIPEDFKTKLPEKIEEYHIKMEGIFDDLINQDHLLTKLRKQKKDEYKNTSVNIQLALNNRMCFDTPINFQENDMLSIRIDKKLNVWSTYTYKKSWGVSNIKISDEDHDEIMKGEISISSKARD
ncbi:hypothetical protein GCM10011344_06200 [Dokdonia pacifica]|uniref:Uncharacterized protein n=1 Tax=Dokdonia pacifica TaxID=1627892 RepID=A0A238ZUS8_9FLAO|nr:hypothetical protein [Dokdonia pacifica]GGG08420.1 hypothetical protein GCM10011344_06200 [Dokdonia pacifica]SNR86413.1 hypothetical protein SAMN06265376_103488 [Dokdonia pacifica]